MCKRSGFTLIELLTVIGIIVLLMAILLPVAQGVKGRARDALCQSNLRQWGIVYKMYTDEFDSKLPRNYGEFAWYYSIRSYYSNTTELLLCPSAKKPSDFDGTDAGPPFGGTFLAWGRFAPKGELAWDGFGSYGLNHWAYKPDSQEDEEPEETEPEGDVHYQGSGLTARRILPQRIHPDSANPRYVSIPRMSSSSAEDANYIQDNNRYWITVHATNTNKIPMIFDSGWLYACFDDNAAPPVSNPITRMGFYGYSNPICMDRHHGGINIAFMDFSTRKVGLKELWTLQWHRQYNTAGRWTRAGGIKPEDWPKWMQKFKDY